MNRRKLKKRIKYLLKKHIPFSINNHINPDEVWFTKAGIVVIWYCSEPEDAGYIGEAFTKSYKDVRLIELVRTHIR